MSYELNDEQYETVLADPDAKRYEHFVKRCADWGEVWLLKRGESDWAITRSEGGDSLAVWPHPRYAESCAVGEWDDREPAPVSVDAFLDDFIPALVEDGMRVAVFPRPGKGGHDVSARQLRSDIDAALAQIP
jgi:hypothetical protein